MNEPIIYTTIDGDVIDQICWRHYGAVAGYVEKVVEANPHLNSQPVILPAGVRISLPVVTVEPVMLKRLWD